MQLFGSFKRCGILGCDPTFDRNSRTSPGRVSRSPATATMERAYTKNDSYFGALDFDKVYIFHELVVLLNKKRKRDINLIDEGTQ